MELYGGMDVLKPHTEPFNLTPNGEPWWAGDLGPRHLEGILAWAGFTSYEQVSKLTEQDLLDLGMQQTDIMVLGQSLSNWLERRQIQAEEAAIFVIEQSMAA